MVFKERAGVLIARESEYDISEDSNMEEFVCQDCGQVYDTPEEADDCCQSENNN